MQPRIPLTFQATSTHCWFTLNFSSTKTPVEKCYGTLKESIADDTEETGIKVKMCEGVVLNPHSFSSIGLSVHLQINK